MKYILIVAVLVSSVSFAVEGPSDNSTKKIQNNDEWLHQNSLDKAEPPETNVKFHHEVMDHHKN